jgi:general secretion pathway protein G
MTHTRHQIHGFTLIEVIVTVTIVAILSALVLPVSKLVAQRSKEQELHTSLRQIRNAIDAYKQAYDDGRIQKTVGSNGYPKNLMVLVEGVEDVRHPKKQKIYFLRRLPRDPFARDSVLSAEETWGKRSYLSSYEAPEEGDDVYDVYSKAAGVGLNEVPYREW